MICRNGRGLVEDYGPSRGRVAGYGGAGLTHPMTIAPMKPFQRAKPAGPPRKRARTYPTCGVLLPRLNELCARRAGHGDMHRSAHCVELDNARRRRLYARGEA